MRWSPSSPYHVATASHDHTVKLWDVRSVVPLATLSAHTEKVLCVGWIPPSTATAQKGGKAAEALAGISGIVSGGADCTLHLHAEAT